MATRGRKKKEEKVKINESYPYTVIGTHLNVTHYEDGSTTMEWNDEALAREVREAIESVEKK
jgi:archaellum component FlaF (FlaF/FlaG flagellin family)